MAKKIKVDFSKTEERSGWNTKAMPEGIHRMRIDAVDITEAGDGTLMWVYALVPTAAKYKSRRFPFYCKHQQNQLWKLRDLYVAAGVEIPKKVVSLDPEQPVGKEIAVEIEESTNVNYAGRMDANSVYGLSILDDDSDDASADSDEDEEYDGDEDEADETDEEEDIDLASMSLAELRKLAKEYDIDTAGLKKGDLIDELTDALADEPLDEDDEDESDDDEDELDDDDLDEDEDDDEYDDEDEDDEEDEEPAPKKRAAAKPAAKSTAKAAPKATAKRTVKRR